MIRWSLAPIFHLPSNVCPRYREDGQVKSPVYYRFMLHTVPPQQLFTSSNKYLWFFKRKKLRMVLNGGIPGGKYWRWLDEFDLDLPPMATTELLDHCLSKFFQFNNCLNQKIKSTPIGSPIFVLIAEAVLQKPERKVFADISPKFWKFHVDETFVIIQENQLPAFHQLLITTPPAITSTIEAPKESKLPFLDVLVHQLPLGVLQTSVWRKGTNVDKVLYTFFARDL